MNYMPVFFVAVAASMGNALASMKALGLLTDLVFAWIQPYMTGLSARPLVMTFAKAHENESIAARHDLDLCGWRQTLRLSIWRSNRRLFVRPFRRKRPVAPGMVADGPRVPRPARSGAALLAAAR